ncbi:DUF3570 domain-containing protein [Aquimarina sp. TRL1]|uniref:DUF3570 domain-containing protein n=1 Tax=Aquimarina sp. (strain TRL1) TaxID=2736252 RepID=UPI0020CB33F6|nr:DUF3570 domain-containing protein [Aquimarina sp. TRL1]
MRKLSFQIQWIIFVFVIGSMTMKAQQSQDSVAVTPYKKRVLETTEIDFLMSYYTQEGDNAAVTGGRGTEELVDTNPAIVVTIPLNDDDILAIDGSVSAYSSASSSNVNPFDGENRADPFVASSGASQNDVLVTLSAAYTHHSDDRNTIWSANVSVANEYDYSSVGGGAGFTKLFNEKNTEFTIKGNVFLDTWKLIYPSELRDNPSFEPFTNNKRNSYAIGANFSQILSKNMQGMLSVDVIFQEGVLSTPFQRIQFADVEDVVIQDFTYGDDVERLPDQRVKVALGGRLHYYLNERIVLRNFYRYYTDDWGIKAHTASIEIPFKISDMFTLYPSYRFYKQTAADYFAPFNKHLSSEEYYTSDYDLSEFNANQFGFGITYTDILTQMRIWKLGVKNIDLRYSLYERNTGLRANLISGGVTFVVE